MKTRRPYNKVDFEYCKKNIAATHRLEIFRTFTGKYELFAYDLFGNNIVTIYKGKSKLKAELLRDYFREYIRELRREMDEVIE